MKKVLLFDCDGVLADTERDGHRVAFNRMWSEFNIPWQWSVEEYGRKLKIGGGKERMASLFHESAFLAVFQPPATEAERQDILKTWHRRKTEIYKEIIASGKIAVRSGVKRLTEEALEQGWVLGVCSTSDREAVESVLLHAVGKENAQKFSLVLAGDVVKAKKPDPEIYLMAASELRVPAEQCVVIEDSRNGLLSAIHADMKCIVTVNDYTHDEDFSESAIVLTCLGDPAGEKCVVLENRSGVFVEGIFGLAALAKILAA